MSESISKTIEQLTKQTWSNFAASNASRPSYGTYKEALNGFIEACQSKDGPLYKKIK